jgi:hypothetical protein
VDAATANNKSVRIEVSIVPHTVAAGGAGGSHGV